MTIAPLLMSVALAHVRVIDGTGGPAKADQTIVIDRDRIQAVGPSSLVVIPPGAEVIDLTGRTVIPGLVGMHDHLFYQIENGGSTTVVAAAKAFARLYLASGVTTIRTAGTADFDGDARLKRLIDAGKEIGPHIHLTGPYLNATTASPDPEGIAGQVATFADRGATSFKAYTSLRSAELAAAIAAAHERGLAVTGHLCAVGFRQAASLGIDNVEHGLAVDAGLYSGTRPDECPDWSAVLGEFMYTDAGDAAVRQTIDALVRHGVRVTSTLAVFESYATADADARVPALLTSRLRSDRSTSRGSSAGRPTPFSPVRPARRRPRRSRSQKSAASHAYRGCPGLRIPNEALTEVSMFN